jgi:hypothetical protein
MNLARTFCGSGQFDEARTYTLRVLQFNPDLGVAKKLLNGLNAGPPEVWALIPPSWRAKIVLRMLSLVVQSVIKSFEKRLKFEDATARRVVLVAA